MPDYCCAAGCPNVYKAGRSCVNDVPLPHFYKIRCSNKEKRKLWLQAIPLKDNLKNYSSEKELKYYRLCSRHFISGSKLNSIDDIDYVPSIFNYKSEAERQEIIDRQSKELQAEGNPLNKRKKEIKQQKKSIKCKYCPSYFSNQKSLLNHEDRSHKPKQCQKCDKVFRNKWYYIRHQRVHSDDRPYVCEVCAWQGKSLGALRIHSRNSHREKEEQRKIKPPLICFECGQHLADEPSLKRHLLIHSSIKRHICDQCGKKFARRDYLKTHMRKHTGEKRFHCSICDKGFTDKRYLTRHMQELHHGQFLSKDSPKSEITIKPKSARRDYLKTQMRKRTGEKRFHCSFCDKGFTDKSYLTRHMQKLHHRYFLSKDIPKTEITIKLIFDS